MTTVRRTGRKTVPPKRYEPEEVPEDDSDHEGSAQGGTEEGDETASEDSGTTGSLADFLTSDDEPVPDSDAGDPDWEMDSADTGTECGTDECDSDVD